MDLNDLVDRFIATCPFFLKWNKGSIDRVMSERFLGTFDFLVKSFPALIAAGISRMEDEGCRTVLAVNLFQECGEGDVKRTHHAIFRNFLATAGIPLLNESQGSFAVEWRRRLQDYILEAESPAAILGVLAAGEFFGPAGPFSNLCGD